MRAVCHSNRVALHLHLHQLGVRHLAGILNAVCAEALVGNVTASASLLPAEIARAAGGGHHDLAWRQS